MDSDSFKMESAGEDNCRLSRRELVMGMVPLALILALIAFVVVSTSIEKARRRKENHLKQFALQWHNFYDQHRRSPKSLEEIEGFRTGFEILFPGSRDLSASAKLISDGDFIIQWNSVFPTTGESYDNYLLGYEPAIFNKPALVMTAGGSVREMTPEEFHSLRPMEFRKD